VAVSINIGQCLPYLGAPGWDISIPIPVSRNVTYLTNRPSLIFFILPSPPVFELNKRRHALLTTIDDKFLAIQQPKFNDFSNKINALNVYFDVSARTLG
jgi:hypothetical protein